MWCQEAKNNSDKETGGGGGQDRMGLQGPLPQPVCRLRVAGLAPQHPSHPHPMWPCPCLHSCLPSAWNPLAPWFFEIPPPFQQPKCNSMEHSPFTTKDWIAFLLTATQLGL